MRESRWQESAGSVLLLAAAQETGLISVLGETVGALATASPVLNSPQPSQQQLVLTLLFLGVVGLDRPWDLRGYSGDGLGLLSGRSRAYGYVHTDRFLGQLAQSDGDQPITEAIAVWVHQVWAEPEPNAPYYIDLHRKPVYSQDLVPRGLIGRTGKVLGCRTVGLLHDGQGHPLLALIERGDIHLTRHLPDLLNRYHHALGQQPVQQVIIDREGMGADFLAGLQDSYQVVTLLKRNQYQDITSFDEVGQFEPLSYDRQGQVVCEVAPAHFSLALSEPAAEQLLLCVALIRDERHQVPLQSAATDPPAAQRLPAEAWWQPEWVATALPAPPTSPKLIPIVSTAPVDDVVALAQLYKQRWRAQENIIRDFLLPLGLDTNHGYTKMRVDNSEVAKRRAELEQQQANVQRWRLNAIERSQRASKLYRRRWQQAHARHDELWLAFNRELTELARFNLPPYLIDRHAQAKQALIEAEMDHLWQGVQRALSNSNCDWAKAQRYVLKERKLLSLLAELEAQARLMFELDNRKDQIMTSLRLALVNLIMWSRDRFFPDSYGQATWKRLAPFFRLPGHIVDHADRQVLYLRAFNDRQLNRDLDALCERVNHLQPRLPDGRYLQFLRYKY